MHIYNLITSHSHKDAKCGIIIVDYTDSEDDGKLAWLLEKCEIYNLYQLYSVSYTSAFYKTWFIILKGCNTLTNDYCI